MKKKVDRVYKKKKSRNQENKGLKLNRGRKIVEDRNKGRKIVEDKNKGRKIVEDKNRRKIVEDKKNRKMMKGVFPTNY